MLPTEFTDLARSVNNWGRWGDSDERGTLNLITPETVLAGVACVRDGKRFSLALPMSEEGPQLGFVKGRTNPIRTTIAHHELMGDNESGVRFNDDAVSMGVQAATHIDALAHVSYDGRMYNGFPTSVVDETGATRLGAEKLGAIASRGVLLDLAGSIGIDRLEGGYPLTPEDLERAEDFGKVTVGAGDIVLLRTGQIQHQLAGDKMAYSITTAGPSMPGVRRWSRPTTSPSRSSHPSVTTCSCRCTCFTSSRWAWFRDRTSTSKRSRLTAPTTDATSSSSTRPPSPSSTPPAPPAPPSSSSSEALLAAAGWRS
jgi:Putative cyclase